MGVTTTGDIKAPDPRPTTGGVAFPRYCVDGAKFRRKPRRTYRDLVHTCSRPVAVDHMGRGAGRACTVPPEGSHPHSTALRTRIPASVRTPVHMRLGLWDRQCPAVRYSFDKATNAAHIRTTPKKNKSDLRDGFKKNSEQPRSAEIGYATHRHGTLSPVRSTRRPKRQGN